MSNSDDSDVVKVNPRFQSEYNEWKKKCPFFYDFIISHPLPRTSLTVHWSTMTPLAHPQDQSLALHGLLFNSYYRRTRTSYLSIANAPLPVPTMDDGPNPILPKVEVTQNLVLDSRLAMARFMPQNPNIVAARTQTTDVYVFDRTKSHANQFDPDLKLTGFAHNVHGHGGAGLAWNKLKEGYVLSSNGHTIRCWDVSAEAQYSYKVIDLMEVYDYFKGTRSLIRDVQWHCKDENVFGSVDDDGHLFIWDLRTDESRDLVGTHNDFKVQSLSFHPYDEWLLATATSDATVCLFDMRDLRKKIYALEGHTEKVSKVEWNPNKGSVLASCGDDRRVIVWDINRIGDEILRGESKAKRPPGLLFSHEGHKDKVTDFSWNDHEPWVISSVAKDGTLQVWKLAQSIRTRR
ncbi:Guanine nucleotide-binding protein, beta subunit [Trema orientale]|uniref:Guanine nucleotide-binding protein, beta subunit n=1 Tax=Trema orientale TaxID=63057 RepID=A0A2P5EWR3_TREOI|nr:Guanine nucleotide-binding protein, beta subunit [Trema orientale]